MPYGTEEDGSSESGVFGDCVRTRIERGIALLFYSCFFEESYRYPQFLFVVASLQKAKRSNAFQNGHS